MAKSTNKKKQTTPLSSNLIIVTGVNSETLRTSIQEETEGKNPNTSFILCGESATRYSDLIEKVSSADANTLAIVPAEKINLLSAVIQTLRQQKEINGKVLIPDFASSKAQRSLLNKFGNSFSKIFGLTEVNGVESGVCIVSKKDAIERNLFDETALKNSQYKLANWCVLNGLKQKSVALPSTTQDDISFSYTKNILSSVGSRFDWFVKQPIKSFSINQFKQGNSGVYRLLFTALVFFSLIILPILSFDFGTTWDEPEDRKYFTEVISYFQTGGEDTRALDESRKLHDHLVNYGPFVNLACAFAEEYLSPFDTYETRHIVLSLFAFIGLLFTGLLARKAGTWRTAVVVVLLLLFTPAFWGHAANNQKDMPFMAFYIASLFYIVRFVQELPKVKLKTIVMTGLTIGILFSIRAGGLLVFAYLALFTGIHFLLSLRNKTGNPMKQLPTYLMNGLITVAIGYFIGVIFWPAALQDPFGHPLAALQNFEKFSLVHIYEIFEGARFYMKDYPWYYAPKMMLITLPLFLLAGVVALIVGFKWFGKSYKLPVVSILFFSIVFPLGYIIYKESSLYNSWRHVLFVLPSLVIISGLGWDSLISLKNKILKIASPVVLAASMLIVGFWMVKNHPYQYMYYNEIVGGVEGAFGNYELDYWCQTPKEAIKWIHDNEDLPEGRTKIISNNEVFSLQYYSDRFQENGEELRENILKVEDINDEIDKLNHYKKEKILTEAEHKVEVDLLLKEKEPLQKIVDSLRQTNILWSRELNWNKDDWDYAIWTNRTLSPTLLEKGYFPPKGTIHTIEVDGVTVAAIVKRENKNIYQANQLMNQRQYAQAEKLLKDYINYDPLEEEAYRTLGYISLAQRKYDDVLKWCGKSLELCPENYFSHHFVALAYLQPIQFQAEGIDVNSRLDSAEKHFKLSAQYKPNFSAAYEGQGDVALYRGNTQLALKFYKESLQYSGNNPQTYYKAGEAYMRLNDINNAANYFNAAIQTNKNYAAPYYGMYQVYLKAGNDAEANKYLQQFQQLSGR